MMYQLKQLVPQPLKQLYHRLMVELAVIWYGNPSQKMIVIGVTGTKGKSTTSNLTGYLLESPSTPVGFTTTANFKIAQKEWINATKMTMLGRFQLQKLLSEMVKAGCKYAVVETSSQGIEQYRHIGVHYDYLIFTNLSPEHLEAHGGFENYKKAKGKLFARLQELPNKVIEGKKIEKKMFINLDDDHANYFLSFPAERKIGFTLEGKHSAQVDKIYQVRAEKYSTEGMDFSMDGTEFNTSLIGQHNLYNIAAALSVAFDEGIDIDSLKHSVRGLKGVPGRMEFINEGQDFMVIVDYAYDPKGMSELYKALNVFPRKKIIQVLGGSGGGRDQSRQAVLGQMAGQQADIIIVTTDDPFDDDPQDIATRLSDGASSVGKQIGENIFLIPDRKEAIKRAISLAQTGDLVLITGKGAEQFMAVKNGGKIMHDDREVARESLKNIK